MVLGKEKFRHLISEWFYSFFASSSQTSSNTRRIILSCFFHTQNIMGFPSTEFHYVLHLIISYRFKYTTCAVSIICRWKKKLQAQLRNVRRRAVHCRKCKIKGYERSNTLVKAWWFWHQKSYKYTNQHICKSDNVISFSNRACVSDN